MQLGCAPNTRRAAGRQVAVAIHEDPKAEVKFMKPTGLAPQNALARLALAVGPQLPTLCGCACRFHHVAGKRPS